MRPRLNAEPVVIDYETFCKIHDRHDRQGLTIAQTARALGLDPKTVATWVARSRFEPRRSRPRGSVLDPFKPRITRLLDTHRPSPAPLWSPRGHRGSGPRQGSGRPAQPGPGTAPDDALPGAVSGCGILLRRSGAAQV